MEVADSKDWLGTVSVLLPGIKVPGPILHMRLDQPQLDKQYGRDM
jgi:hypothetical protein